MTTMSIEEEGYGGDDDDDPIEDPQTPYRRTNYAPSEQRYITEVISFYSLGAANVNIIQFE